jgi:ketosteroid isomerase-like protein
MTSAQPEVIAEYLGAADRRDTDAVVACFAADAVVVDEGRTWRGADAIRRWQDTVATAYQYAVELRGADALGEHDGTSRYDFHAHLEGNFPGGQVDLTYRFELRDRRITSLEIVPTPRPESCGS